jgi:hypothetical protein
LNPGPHGPEIQAVSSTVSVCEGFEFDSILGWRLRAGFSHLSLLDYFMNCYMDSVRKGPTESRLADWEMRIRYPATCSAVPSAES